MAFSTSNKSQAAAVVRALGSAYPDVTCALEYQTPLQLLVATILSAQCTDQRVNLVTRELFPRYATAADLAALPTATLEEAIQSTGFYRNKARNIKACCQQLVHEYDGRLPASLEALVALPGVGRKTANVVMGTAFGIATGVVVDTHVSRLSRRLGLTVEKTAEKIERDLMDVLPEKEWIDFSHRMIHHGRQVCKARKPACDMCSLARCCPRIGVVG